MATSTKDTTTLVKEKRGTSPSNSRTTHSQRSTKQSPTASTDKVKSPQSASAAPKQVPNYLRPTISSRPESFKYVKKTNPEDATQKARLLRRRSFDKPPSASQGGNFSPGPRERAGPAQERVMTVKSSSISSKTTTSSKPIVDKISKTPKAVKSQFPSSKSIKKSPSPSIEKETNASDWRTASSSHDVTETLNLETNQDDIDPMVHEAGEIVNAESEVQVPCEIPKSDNKEHVDVVDTEVNNAEAEKLKSSDISTVTSEDLSAAQAVEIEETEEKSHEEKTNTTHETEENHSKDESDESHPEESLASEAKIEAEDKGEENASEKADSSEETGDENKVEGKDQDDEGSEGDKSKEGQQVEVGVEEAKPEAANVVAAKRQGGQGKKESPAAYNDVIEETASKLLEKRKNKVKALVGAFETVIDYESSSK